MANENYIMLNLDETSLQNDYIQKRGYVVDMLPEQRTIAGCFFQRVTMSDTRSHTTLVAAIAAKPGVRRHIPQILIPNDSKITVAERSFYSSLQFPVEVMLGHHGWVNTEVMKKLLTRYRRAVRAIDAEARLVLLMDSASQHISNDVLRHAQMLGVVILLIPGKLTWLLQPLDVSVFRVFKDNLKKKLLHIRMADDRGLVSIEQRIIAVHDTILEVLIDMDWSASFPKVGASLHLEDLRATVKRLLPGVLALVPAELNIEQIEDVIGRHRLEIDGRLFRLPRRIIDQRTESQMSLEMPPMPAPLEAPGPEDDETMPPDSEPIGMLLPPRPRASSSRSLQER